MTKLTINNNVRRCRFLNNEMTQQELAKQLGVSRQTIIAIEKGQYSPSLELAFKLSLVFKMKIDDIFYVEADNENI